jgi:hypothetical protein
VEGELTLSKQSCRQGIRSEARYVRSKDGAITEGTGVLENLMLIATFGVLCRCLACVCIAVNVSVKDGKE